MITACHSFAVCCCCCLFRTKMPFLFRVGTAVLPLRCRVAKNLYEMCFCCSHQLRLPLLYIRSDSLLVGGAVSALLLTPMPLFLVMPQFAVSCFGFRQPLIDDKSKKCCAIWDGAKNLAKMGACSYSKCNMKLHWPIRWNQSLARPYTYI